MNLILIGYRGSGKSTVGRKLADRLGLTFVDTDDEIQRRFGNKTIAQIWNQYGPRAFRDLEALVVDELTDRADQVIALGGGTIIEPDARGAVQRATHATRIYLHCDPDELERRLAADAGRRDTRPHHGYPANLEHHIREHLAEREPIYRMVADTVVDVTARPVQDVVRQIVALVDPSTDEPANQ
jgi:shikimate kinase